MAFDLKKFIVDSTKYKSGFVNEDDQYVLSASMVGKEPLENYLSIIYGKGDQDDFNDATLGTVFHRGMEYIIEEGITELLGLGPVKYCDADEDIINVFSEKSLNYELENGWQITGTADLIIELSNKNWEIHDFKLTKKYTRKMHTKELYNHAYTKQLHVLEFLLRMNDNGFANTIKNVLLVDDYFLKDSKIAEFEPVLEPLVVPNKSGHVEPLYDEDGDRIGENFYSGTEVMIKELIEQTNKLEEYIETGIIPPKCSDTWPRKVKGKTVHMKCEHYCSHKDVCPHYDPGSDIMQSTNLANW